MEVRGPRDGSDGQDDMHFKRQVCPEAEPGMICSIRELEKMCSVFCDTVIKCDTMYLEVDRN